MAVAGPPLGECQTLTSPPLISDLSLPPCRGEAGPTRLNFLEKLQSDVHCLSQTAGWVPALGAWLHQHR